jgi:hypothetical protein
MHYQRNLAAKCPHRPIAASLLGFRSGKETS